MKTTQKKRRPTLSTGMGDAGKTMLYGGQFVPKDAPRIHAYGTIDELNAAIGLVLAEGVPDVLRGQLTSIQKLLFDVGADLATPIAPKTPKVRRIDDGDVHLLEEWGVALEADLPPLNAFILPGGSKAGAFLHLARTVCRRAERHIITLTKEEAVNDAVRIFVNRLSDYLFLAARIANRAAGLADTPWHP